ncbi:predicted protein, partial [Nematostella vectensis]
ELQSRINIPSKQNEKTKNLTNSEISRYSRQLILPEIGVKGQQSLKSSSVLVVGAGGLGCPAALYLAAAGIGCLGLVDYDVVDTSNLHRQVLHTEDRVEVPKVESAKQTLLRLNSDAQYNTHCLQLNSVNALDIINKYDVIVDATDNVATRYLLNDACVLAKKPLVSGSALRLEGQLVVYNHDNGPCYRCLFPTPPPPETVGNCSDNGVLGAVPGIIGTLQAIEVIKIITSGKSSFSRKMLVYDAMDSRFLQVKLRPKQQTCSVCGDSPTIHTLIDYEQFCGTAATDKSKPISILERENRISVQEYSSILDCKQPHILLDVREPVELDICALPDTLNIPLRRLSSKYHINQLAQNIDQLSNHTSTGDPVNVYVVCRLGNDSQKAVQILQQKRIVFKDIIGGLAAWARKIDNTFPVY